MFDDLLDIFERERRRPGERRGGLRGLLGRVVGDDHDNRHAYRRGGTERHRSVLHDRDDRHGGSDEGTYRGTRRRHGRRDAFDWDD